MIFSARDRGLQGLYCRWTLVANILQCEDMLFLIIFYTLLNAETFFICWIFFSDDWSYGDLELVSDVCWLVWTKVVSKDLHSKWDITRFHEKCHGMVSNVMFFKTVIIMSFLILLFFSVLPCDLVSDWRDEYTRHKCGRGIFSSRSLSFVATLHLSLSLYFWTCGFWSMEMSCIGHVHGTGLHGLVICLQGSSILMLLTHCLTSSQTLIL